MKKINLKRICASVLAGIMVSGFNINTNALADNNQRVEHFLINEDEITNNNTYFINDDYENLLGEEGIALYNRVISSMLKQDWVIELSDDEELNLLVCYAVYNSVYDLVTDVIDYDYDSKTLFLNYIHPLNTQNDILRNIDTKMNLIRDEIITDDMSDTDKVLAIYTYVVDNYAVLLTYPRDHILEDGRQIKVYIDYLLEHKTGVCHTFSYFIDYLCQMEGIESYLITGYIGKTKHMWNMIRLDDGNLYFFDATQAILHGRALGNNTMYFGMTKQEFTSGSYSIKKKDYPKSVKVKVKTLPELRYIRNVKYLGNHIFEIVNRFNGIQYLNTETREIGNTLEEVQIKVK